MNSDDPAPLNLHRDDGSDWLPSEAESLTRDWVAMMEAIARDRGAPDGCGFRLGPIAWTYPPIAPVPPDVVRPVKGQRWEQTAKSAPTIASAST